MHCSTCGHANRDQARFCEECGGPLSGCPSCGAELRATAKFCDSCGQPVRSRDAQGEPVQRDPRSYTPKHLADKILQSKSALEGERKQVTVLFVDVKGSMGLTEGVDPEEWHAVMDRFFQILTDGVHRFEGTVNQYTGDGIMALFGAPIAHEDHARRACYAALHLNDELRRYANELRLNRGMSFSVRMGLNSGEVVVGRIGDDLRMDYTAQGHTVGIAARMQQLAEPGKAYVTEHTGELVRGYFQLGDLGELDVKGLEERVGVHELEGVGTLRTRLDVSRARGFSRFVGRIDEMQVLEAALARAEEGTPQVIGIVADAGVGKSRLCFEFLERCRARGLMTYESHGVAHGKSVPLLPILRLFRAFFGITEQDSDATARERIAGRLLLLDEKFREMLPLMFDFLGVADPSSPAPKVDAETRQRQLFAIVRGVTQARAGSETTVALLEDLHWFDGGSEAFLEPLLDLPPGARSLMIVNFRPEFRVEWMQKSSYQQIPLQPLGPEAIAELLTDLLGNDSSLERLPKLIRERTGGNPFFIEEVVLSLAEAGVLEGTKGVYRLARPIGEVGIPRTVHDILAARIDRLEERDKQVLQSAAVIGKKFPEPVLRRIMELADIDLVTALRTLQNAEFIYEESLYPETEYAFKHPLTQQVSYDTQLRERRARIHAAVARVIEDLYADKLDEQAALLAYHWEEAGEPLLAARWNGRAAKWSGRTDPAEALRHWRKARSLLQETPGTSERDELELEACRAILPLCWRVGVPAEVSTEAFARGRDLAEPRGDRKSLAVLHLHYSICRGWGQADVPGLSKHAREAASMAERVDDEGLSLAVASALVLTGFVEGKLDEAVEIGKRALQAPPDDATLGSEHWGFPAYPQLLGLTRAFEAWAGRPSGTVEDLEQAIGMAREQGSAELQSYNHLWAVTAAEFLGRADAAMAHGLQALETAEKSGVPLALVYANYGLGIANCRAESWEAATDCLERAVTIANDEEAALLEEPAFLARLAEAYAGLGDAARAKKTVERALVLARERRLPLHEAIALIVRSRVLRQTERAGAHEAIEGTLGEAEALVETTGLRSWQPFIQLERAELARLVGDEDARQRELHKAHILFSEMGATAHVERIAAEIDAA
jgi:class 3 adenylate cyclase/tetratricopeptide (TPR) repeat protein